MHLFARSITVVTYLLGVCSAFKVPGRVNVGGNGLIPSSCRGWNLHSSIRSTFNGHPNPRKLHKRPFWADMFDEEVEIEPLGPPCPKLLDDVVRGERRLRLTLKRSHRQMCATIVDDVARHVHCFMSTNFRYLGHIFGQEPTKDPKIMRNKGGNVRAAYELGKLIGRQARQKGISRVVFDRAGYRYHGRVEALAIGARKVGLDF
ncbi:50S ribosomal protein L18, putative [Babesia bigemina]|uniref:50S ribosomal protein L18, putative n=1 Tax=Babesia bigemina TaxID=5866 RepID=A0A061D4L2_BABBI|nr:50S ribosomal protein L18, putative [Babesia bigemina]CDR95513.1 50S ribosomal protein L18, putative [Babesia bigemina]|eukprot:XP_012767699.1 50S ribosomal protein L18, putative [Babesia bigemina]